ncbi:MAG: RluA family pseudouridine synthase [Burkholderiales bacterium]|nr:RluA family pseudouridine synthase [Burkholderiales bacterium]
MKALSKDSATWMDADDNCAGQRIDNLLARLLKGVPRRHIYRLLRTGQVRVNSARVDATYRIRSADRIRIPPVRTASRNAEAPNGPSERLEARILFEDESMLVLDKPAGMAVHGGSGISRGIIEAMRHSRPKLRFLELAHRLDRDTSGVLLLAKKRAALVGLHAAMRSGRVRKLYTVLMLGRAKLGSHEVDAPLAKYLLPGGDRRVRVARDGLAARTIFTGLRHIGTFTLAEAELLTGRTHQIRVHSASLGHPIAGDDKYGDFAANKALARSGLKRLFLHAGRVVLEHPVSAVRLDLRSPLAADLASFLERLEAERGGVS